MYFVIQSNMVLFRLAHMFQIIFVGISRTEQDPVLKKTDSLSTFWVFFLKVFTSLALFRPSHGFIVHSN